MYHIFLIRSSVDGYFCYFHVLTIVNSAAVNIGVHVPFGTIIFSEYMPRHRIAWSSGTSIFLFSFFFFLSFNQGTTYKCIAGRFFTIWTTSEAPPTTGTLTHRLSSLPLEKLLLQAMCYTRIHDRRRRGFLSGIRDEAWLLGAFCVAKFY